MKLKFVVLFLILFSFTSARAMPEEATFGLEQGSKEWKKKELEDWLTHKIAVDLEQFVPAELFKIYTNATFKNQKSTTRHVSNVNLTMLGTVATIVQTESTRPQLGLFDRIDKLDITLVVADSVPQKTVDAMLTVVTKRIPLLDSSRISTEVVRLEKPSLTFAAWLKEFKGVIGGLFALALVFFALFKTLQRVRIRGSIQIGPSEAAHVAHVNEDETAPMPEMHEYAELARVQNVKPRSAPQTVSNLGLSLDQIDPASEEQFLKVLLMKSEFANFAHLVRQSLPNELIKYAPEAAIKAALSHMSHSDRLEVLAFAPQELEETLWSQLPKPVQAARALLAKDVELLRSEAGHAAQTPQQAYSRFMKTVREAIRKNKEWSKAVHPHVENWIFVKTKGIEGRPYGNKVA